MNAWETHEWIVIILIAAPFGIWLASHYFWLGRRYRWPGLEASRRVMIHNGYKVHVLTSAAPPGIELQSCCAKAVFAAAQGWTLAGHSRADRKIGEVAIWFRPDVEFDSEPREPLRRAAAYLVRVPRSVGGSMPLAVVRVSLTRHVMEAGEPVIHTMMHALDDWDPEHTEPDIWEATGGAKSAQDRAQRVYLRVVRTDAYA